MAAVVAAATLAGCGSGRTATSESTAPTSVSTPAGRGRPANLAPNRNPSLPLGARGCPGAWATEPLLACGDVPKGLSADPGFGDSSGQSLNASTRYEATKLGCTSGVAEAFIWGGSSGQASNGAILVSGAISCPTVSAADGALSTELTTSKATLSNPTVDASAPTVGERSDVILSYGTKHDDASVFAVYRTSLILVDVQASVTMPIAEIHALASPAAIVSFARDQLRQLQRVGPLRS